MPVSYTHLDVYKRQDLMIDVRFLPNPFWDEKLRYFSGNDKEVYDYVMDKRCV